MMNFVKIIFISIFSILYILVGCGIDKPTETIDDGDTDTTVIIDTISDTVIDTTTMPKNVMITIERTYHSVQGQLETIEISMNNAVSNNFLMGGYDFLIGYDAGALLFQGANAGQFLTDCGWEYFTYRYGLTNHEPGSFTGEIRVVAIAETNNGSYHPTCFNDSGSVSNQLAILNFLVTNDRYRECTFAPVQFFWYDCLDNVISSVSGDQLFFNNHIYNYEDTNTINDSINLADDVPFPSYYGVNSTCDSITQQDYYRVIDFINGGVEINCADPIDARGDINHNEIAYEIADADLYANYFVYGLLVFNINPEGQIEASDINADGLTLTLADLVYHIRVLNGDAIPFRPEAVNEPTYIDATYKINNGTISVVDDILISAAHIVVFGDITPTLLADNMTMYFSYDGTNTNIIIFSVENNNFTGEMINIGNNEIVSIDMADNIGNQVNALIEFAVSLSQNYPNPFIKSTTIPFSMNYQAEVTLQVTNYLGVQVFIETKTFDAGDNEFIFFANGLHPGEYKYTISVNGFEESKTMMIVR